MNKKIAIIYDNNRCYTKKMSDHIRHGIHSEKINSVMYELAECRKLNSSGYIKIQAFDATRNVESCVLSFIVNRPSSEPGFYLSRTEDRGRFQKYSIQSYSVAGSPAGARY